jgi:hypothetical protein
VAGNLDSRKLKQDLNMRFPRGGNRHSTEIDQLFTQWIDCQELYQQKCQNGNKPCDKIPQVAPKPPPLLPILPLLEEILEGLGLAAL